MEGGSRLCGTNGECLQGFLSLVKSSKDPKHFLANPDANSAKYHFEIETRPMPAQKAELSVQQTQIDFSQPVFSPSEVFVLCLFILGGFLLNALRLYHKRHEKRAYLTPFLEDEL